MDPLDPEAFGPISSFNDEIAQQRLKLLVRQILFLYPIAKRIGLCVRGSIEREHKKLEKIADQVESGLISVDQAAMEIMEIIKEGNQKLEVPLALFINVNISREAVQDQIAAYRWFIHEVQKLHEFVESPTEISRCVMQLAYDVDGDHLLPSLAAKDLSRWIDEINDQLPLELRYPELDPRLYI